MKDLFLVFVALVIPLFFVFIFLMSTRTRLAAARERCREAESALRATRGEGHQEAAQGKWEAAAADYETARSAFPGRWFATLIGFAPLKPTTTADSSERPIPVSEGMPPR